MTDDLSFVPIAIETYFQEKALAIATGFVIHSNNEDYLITNWHVVSGKHPDTNELLSETGAIPDNIRVWFHPKREKDHHGNWIWASTLIDILDDYVQKWIEHPKGSAVDVVAIRLDNIVLGDLSHSLSGIGSENTIFPPSTPISIIGYPHGHASFGLLPIWKTGHVASEMSLNYDNKPMFLIDATTSEGMSGAPVFTIRDESKNEDTSTGFVTNLGAPLFLGIYSGRLDPSMDVGMVWKENAIREVIDNDLENPASRSYFENQKKKYNK